MSKDTWGPRFAQLGIQPEEFTYFKEIFDLESRAFEGYKSSDRRIDFDAFNRIFQMVGYEPN